MLIDEFTVAAEIAFERLMTPTKGLRPEVMDEPMEADRWSFKELGVHLTEWNARLLKAVEAVYHDREIEDRVPFPCAEAGERRGGAAGLSLPLKRAMNELRVGHSALMEAAKRVDWKKLDRDGHIPEWLTQGMIEHYTLHRECVEVWVAGLVREGRGPLSVLPVK